MSRVSALDGLPFLWGAGTSAHQVEGGNDGNDWHDWERADGTPCVERSADACDHLRRYRDDVRLLADAGLNSYRFSLEWSRIEPAPGQFEDRWLAHYRDMADACRACGLLPVVTFHHFTNPRWVAADGGWTEPRTAERFARYCARAAEALGESIAVALTINEPNILALLAYEDGVFPPGTRDHESRLRATGVLIRAHRLAAAALQERLPGVPVGLALGMAEWQALPGGELQLADTRRLREDVFLKAVREDDFVGVNTYTRHRIGPRGWLPCEDGAELTATGWEFRPEALEPTLRRAFELAGRPIIVTESGVATDDDSRRVEFIERAVDSMWWSAAFGVDVRGFIYWSALDNFEWHLGFAPRFGLIEVDRATQERAVRPSALRLGAIARESLSPASA